jgi:thiaminase/transcriptional activator TenA
MAILISTTPFCDRLRDASRGMWEQQFQHPFVRALGDGTLPRDVFEFYIRQDARFLDHLAKTFAFAATKTSDREEMRQFGERFLHTLAVEKALHEGYAAQFGVTLEEMAATPMAPTNFAYTRHILYVAATGSLASLIAAILPCAWIYSAVGQQFSSLLGGPPSPEHPYGAWIGTYSTPEFEEVGAWLRARLEERVASVGEAERREIEQIFLTSSRYEYMFWDMAYRKEAWPI